MSGRIPMAKVDRFWRALAARLCVGLLVCLAWIGPAVSAERGEPKRVLLLHSFGRDFRPWSEYARSIKAALDIYEQDRREEVEKTQHAADVRQELGTHHPMGCVRIEHSR